MAAERPLETGHVLVAAPRLHDPNFARGVVLVCALDEAGALGLLLDRPTAEPAARHLDAWERCLSPPALVFVGGPVQPETAVGLVRVTEGFHHEAFSPVVPGFGLFDLEVGPVEGVMGARVFSGYAGWGPGQLEAEVAAGDWFVVDAEPEDPLTTEPMRLRSRVLRRQGLPLALYVTAPPDPALN